MTPLFPVIILLLGAVVLPLTNRIALKWATYAVALVVSGGTVLSCMLLYLSQGGEASIALWRPSSLFGVELGYYADNVTLLFLLLIAFVNLIAILSVSPFVNPMKGRPLAYAAGFLAVAGAFSPILSADLMTLCLSWGLLDLAILLLVAVAHDGQEASRAGLRPLLINYLGGVALLGALLLLQGQEEIYSLQAAPLPTKVISLMILAALLRLGLYPVRLALPATEGMRTPTLILWHAIPLCAGGYLLARALGLAAVASLPGRELALVLGSLAVFLSPFPLWFAQSARGAAPYIILNQVGLLTLAAAIAPSQPLAIIASQTISLVLAVTLLLVSQTGSGGRLPRVYAIWRRSCLLVAVASLVATPLTVGFLSRQLLYAWLVESNLGPLILLSLVANTFLVAPLLKMAMEPPQEDAGEGGSRTVRLASMTALAIPLVALGVHPPLLGLLMGSQSTLATWPSVAELVYSPQSVSPLVLFVATLLSLAAGYLTYVKGEAVVARAGVSLETLDVVARMGWLLRGLDWAVRRVALVLEQISGFFEESRFQGWILVFATLLALLLLSS